MEQVLYKLPDGWEWSKLTDVCTPLRKTVEPNPEEQYNYIGLENIESHTGKVISDSPTKGSEISSTKVSFKKGMVLYGKLRPYLNKVIVAKTDGIATTEIIPFECSDAISPDFLAYYLRSQYFVDLAMNNCSGARMPRATTKLFTQIAKIPVTSITEQKRIAEKLDALLTRIDTAIEHLQESAKLKNSLLQSALDGQFTSISERMTIESIAEVKGGKRLPKGEKLSDEETEHPYIRVADFTDKGTIDLSGIKYISKEIHEQIKRYVISKDDLYISIAGTIGKTGFVPPELHGANLTENAAKLVIRDKQQLDLSYLYLFTLTSDFSEQAGLATKTVAQPKLALTRLSKIEIPMCSLEEQLSLVSTIETLKTKIHDAETVFLGKIEDLRSLKASILDSAFKGEL
tara:strand:- start:1084 stop:2289 length:1206 start_codon:yes stop_codon:yes gene_type:complete